MKQSDRLNKRAFFRSLGYKPHPGQVGVHGSRAPRRIVACGVRWGKTLCAAMEGLAAAMEPKERSFGWVVAPTYDLADKVFREIAYISSNHLQHHVLSIKEGERRIKLRNMGGGVSDIRGKSADNSVSLLGEGLDWLIVDEAARLRPHIWESHLSQRLIDKRGWALLISTPRGKGFFYDLYRRGKGDDPDYSAWNNPSWTNPHLDAELIENERSRLPERVYFQEYGAQFLEGSGQVFRNIRECATGELQEPIEGARYFAGLDLAKVEDYTVLVIVNKDREVVHVDRFHRLDWNLQINRIVAATQRYGVQRTLVDSTGAGEPIFEALKREGCKVGAYPFTQKSKAALIDNLSMMLEQGMIILPRPELWPEGIDELESFQYSVSDSGNVKSGAPSGYHDDCAIAVALAAWEVRPSRPKPHFTGAPRLFLGTPSIPTWP